MTNHYQVKRTIVLYFVVHFNPSVRLRYTLKPLKMGLKIPAFQTQRYKLLIPVRDDPTFCCKA